MARGLLSAEEAAFQICVHDQVPLFFGDVEQGLEGLYSGVIDQDVETAKASAGLDGRQCGESAM